MVLPAIATLIAATHAYELIQAGLTDSDLTLSGKELYRKLDGLLNPVGELDRYGQAIARVQGASDMLVVDWRKTGHYFEQPPILVYKAEGRVRARYFPTTPQGIGWNGAAFRMVGKTLIGCGYATPGNWSMPVAMALKKSGADWKLIARKTMRDEISSIQFAKPTGSDIAMEFRSYDFKILTAPHAGPLLTYAAKWRLVGTTFVMDEPKLERNALAAFDDLVEGVYLNKPAQVRRVIPDPSLRAYFVSRLKELNGAREVVCVGSYNFEQGTVFGIEDVARRGDWRASLFVAFAKRRDGWQVTKIGREYNFAIGKKYNFRSPRLTSR